MINDRKAACVALNFVQGIGPKMFENLLNRFSHPEAVIAETIEELCTIPRLTQKIAESIHAINIDAVAAELAALEEVGITVHTVDEQTYPPNLKSIPNPPPILFQSGKFLADDTISIAIVGTRKPSATGVKLARELALGLAKRGFTIVSGMALGIDTATHRGALEAGGRTLAVLGSGIQVIYPRQNQGLAEQIRHSGAVFSELKPNAPPASGTLMSRDRIVSGLSLAVIVVEANERSGSMDTAKQAQKQGRQLFAVDNPSTGNQRLIAQGITSIAEVTESSLNWIAEKTIEGGHASKPSQMTLF